MKVYSEISLFDFDAWSGAIDRKERIIEAGKEEEFEALIEEQYPEGIEDVQLNDILWFEEEMIFDALGISDEEEEDEEEEEGEEEEGEEEEE